MAKRTVRKGKKREKKNISYGVAHIYSTFNNTILCISDRGGNVLSWSSGGNVGSRGPASPPHSRRRSRRSRWPRELRITACVRSTSS